MKLFPIFALGNYTNILLKRFVLVVILSLVVCFVTVEAAGKRLSSSNGAFVENPMLWADVPDPDIIRVGDAYYLVSTTMHLMPGAPIMRSRDLKNWETIGYVYDRLTDSPKYDLQQGTVYGRGQWATSLKYHNGRFYVLFAPNEQGALWATPIFIVPKTLLASGPWCHACATSTTVRSSSTTTIVYMLSMVLAR